MQVSVIVPAYNSEAWIKRAVQSVLSQTITDIEIIVIDDCSNDRTGEVIQQIDDPRIKYICSQKNEGAGGARNRGIQMARGEYLAFIDSDDEWMPTKLQRQLELLSSLAESWGVCHTGCIIVKDGQRSITQLPKEQFSGWALNHYLHNRFGFLNPSTLLVRRAVIEDVGLFDVRLLRGQDYDWFLRVFQKYQLALVSESLAVIHLSTTKCLSEKVVPARQLIIDKHQAMICRELGSFAAAYFCGRNYWDMAEACFRDDRRLSGWYYWLKALRCNPLQNLRRYATMLLLASALFGPAKRFLCRKI